MRKHLRQIIADETIFTVLLLMLVAVVSFGLGRQSVSSANSVLAAQTAGVSYIAAPPLVAAEQPAVSVVEDWPQATLPAVATRVVASKTGSKYHLLTCPGASQIKEENKVYYDSPALAVAAGLQPAANCPGLQK